MKSEGFKDLHACIYDVATTAKHCQVILHVYHYYVSQSNSLLVNECILMTAAVVFVCFVTGDHSGVQPVHEAALANQLACMTLLLKKGGRAAVALDGEGRTALHKV